MSQNKSPLSVVSAVLALAIGLTAPNAFAYKNITDYEHPFVMFQKISSARTFSKAELKTPNSDGKTKEKFNMTVNRYTIGLHRERYDNNFGHIGLFYAEGVNDATTSEALPDGKGVRETSIYKDKPKMKEQFGFIYANGIHITKRVDWSLSIELSTSKFKLEGENKSKLGAGLGTDIVFKPVKHFQIGASLLLSSQYMGGGLSARLQY